MHVFILLIALIQVDEDRASGPTGLQLRLVARDIDFLRAGDAPSVSRVLMPKWPVSRVDAVLIVEDHVVDKEMVVIGVEQDSDGLVLIARDEVKVVFAGELVDLEDAPDGVVQVDDRLLL